MRKTVLVMLLGAALVLSGCQKGEGPASPVPAVEDSPAVAAEESKVPETVDPRLNVEDFALADWQRGYIDFLEGAAWEAAEYALYDMDGDEIPELITLKREYPGSDVETVYTFRDGEFQSLGEFEGDEPFYVWAEEKAILVDDRGGLLTGMGGTAVTLSGGKVKIETVEDADLPRGTSEFWETPVLGAEELIFYRISAGAPEGEERTLILPVLLYDAQPESLSEEEKEEGRNKLQSVLEGGTMFYHVPEASYYSGQGWVLLPRYCAPGGTGKPGMKEQLSVRRTLYQDLNGDGLEEAVLYLEEDGDSIYREKETLVLSVQEGIVYGYALGNWNWLEPMEDGALWGQSGRAEYGLRFCRDQAYTWDLTWPQAFLLYKTTEEVSDGIRRTTLDPQGTELSCYFEVPVFPGTGKGYQKINRFFEDLTRDFFSPERGLDGAWEYAMMFRNYGREGPFPYEHTAHVTYQTDKLVSVVLSSFWNMGGVNGTWSESYTFRTDTGELLALVDLVKGSREEIKETILTDIEKNREFFYEPEQALEAAREYSVEDFEFCLTPEGIALNLDRYELGRIGAESSTSLLTTLELRPEWK